MSRQDRILYLGSTWFIDGVALDRFGKPLDMTGGAVEIRLVGPSGLLLTLTSPTDVSIASGVTGAYTGTLAASDSRQASLAPGLFDYEIDAISASGVVSVQTFGKIMLSESLRALYPGGTVPDTTPPTITSPSSYTVTENSAFSHTLTASESVVWSKTGGADASLFTLSGAILSLPAKNFEAPADSDANNAYVVQVTATDTSGNATVQTITVTVTDVDEVAPTITSGSSFSQAENAAFSLSLTANETVTWSKTGGADAALFTLSGATLTMAAKDFEIPTDADANNVYVVQVRATDTAGNQTDQTITVTVTDVVEISGYPAFTSSASQTIAENAPFSLSLATDISSTFAIVGGADAALFNLSGSTVGATAFDYEAPADAGANNVYNITVRATSVADPSKYTDQAMTITVTNVGEDSTPNAFTFTDVTGATVSTDYTSNTITVAGIDTTSAISITGGAYSKNGGSFTSSSGTVVNGDTIAVRVTSSGSGSTAVNAVLTIGGVSDTYTVTTVSTSLLDLPFYTMSSLADLTAKSVTFSRSSTGTFFDGSPALSTAASGNPRFDYDPATLAEKGLLLEAGATNYCLESEFGGSAWTGQDLSVSASGITERTSVLKKITTAGNGLDRLFQSVSLPVGTVTYSFFFKGGANVPYIHARAVIGGISYGKCIDIATGALTTGYYDGTSPSDAPISARCVSLGGGIFRFEMTVASDGFSFTAIYFGSSATSTGAGMTAGGYAYIGGVQMEPSSFATSYIPTTTASVTRATDAASFFVPTGVTSLALIYADASTASVSVTPSATYNIPTNQLAYHSITG